MSPNDASWTVHELTRLASLALADDYGGQENGQVRDVPDLRTIRYYTTLGILDRPAAMQGRTALYGRRHLLQLVAIKRLQAEGHTLRTVQERLLGLTTGALARLARVPSRVLESRAGEAPGSTLPSRRAGAFWKAAPTPVAVPRAPAVRSLQALELEPGATLLLSLDRPVADDDVKTVREAARPLLETLKRLGLHTA